MYIMHNLSYALIIIIMFYPPASAQIVFLNQFVSTLMDSLRSSPLHESYCPESVPKLNVMEFIQHYILIGKSKKYVYQSSLQIMLVVMHYSSSYIW